MLHSAAGNVARAADTRLSDAICGTHAMYNNNNNNTECPTVLLYGQDPVDFTFLHWAPDPRPETFNYIQTGLGNSPTAEFNRHCHSNKCMYHQCDVQFNL